MYKDKKLTDFVRFGGLDIKNQAGYSTNPTSTHEPPATKGFYAFPKVAQDFYLLSALDKTQRGFMPKNYLQGEFLGFDENGEPEYYRTFVDDSLYNKKYREQLRRIRKEFTKTRGFIWHHLGFFVKPQDVVATHGSWVKTTIQVWKKAFSKMSIKYRYSCGSFFKTNSINNTKGITGFASKDMCEVFFDEKV